MNDARSDRHVRGINRPYRALVSAITLVAFLFNMVQYDIAYSAEPDSSTIRAINVDTFVLPAYMGYLRDSFKAPGSNRLVVYIQDAHCNYYAQKRISEIVEYLNSEFGIKSVNLEGGARDYDLSLLTKIADKDTRRRASEYLVKEGLMNGSEYFAANNPGKIGLWGVEDVGLYMDNLHVYRDSFQHRDEIDKAIKSLSYILTNLKLKIYSKELLEFDQKYLQYKAGSLDFKSYLDYLIKQAKTYLIDIKHYHNIFLLDQSLEAENEVNFKKANDQRDALIDKLQKTLSRNALEGLLAKTVDFRMEKISQKEFYSYLVKKAESVKVDMTQYPELRKYMIYISIYDAVDKTKIGQETDALENAIRAILYKDDTQKELGTLSKNLALIKNLFGISLTRDDYNYYVANIDSFASSNFIKFIERQAPLYKITAQPDPSVKDLDSYREKMSAFYEDSLKRDTAFLKNIRFDKPVIARRPKADEAISSVAIIVTGGFHSENLADLFRKKGISYISIMPNFRSCDGYECPYYKLLSGEKSLDVNKYMPAAMKSVLAIQDPFNPAINGGVMPTTAAAPASVASPLARAIGLNQNRLQEAIKKMVEEGIARRAETKIDLGVNYQPSKIIAGDQQSVRATPTEMGLIHYHHIESRDNTHFYLLSSQDFSGQPEVEGCSVVAVWGNENIGFWATEVRTTDKKDYIDTAMSDGITPRDLMPDELANKLPDGAIRFYKLDIARAGEDGFIAEIKPSDASKAVVLIKGSFDQIERKFIEQDKANEEEAFKAWTRTKYEGLEDAIKDEMGRVKGYLLSSKNNVDRSRFEAMLRGLKRAFAWATAPAPVAAPAQTITITKSAGILKSGKTMEAIAQEIADVYNSATGENVSADVDGARKDIEENKMMFVVADGKIVAYIIYETTTRKTDRQEVGYIRMVMKRGDYKVKNVGSALVDKAIEIMRSRGFSEVMIEPEYGSGAWWNNYFTSRNYPASDFEKVRFGYANIAPAAAPGGTGMGRVNARWFATIFVGLPLGLYIGGSLGALIASAFILLDGLGYAEKIWSAIRGRPSGVAPAVQKPARPTILAPNAVAPAAPVMNSKGQMQNGFTPAETQAILATTNDVDSQDKVKLSVLSVIADKLQPNLFYRILIFLVVKNSSNANIMQRIVDRLINKASLTPEDKAILKAAIKFLAGARLTGFSGGRAIVDKEKYVMGMNVAGQNKIALIEAFFSRYPGRLYGNTPLNQPSLLAEALLHEALEAVTPEGNNGELFAGIQRSIFGEKDPLQAAMRTYINETVVRMQPAMDIRQEYRQHVIDRLKGIFGVGLEVAADKEMYDAAERLNTSFLYYFANVEDRLVRLIANMRIVTKDNFRSIVIFLGRITDLFVFRELAFLVQALSYSPIKGILADPEFQKKYREASDRSGNIAGYVLGMLVIKNRIDASNAAQVCDTITNILTNSDFGTVTDPDSAQRYIDSHKDLSDVEKNIILLIGFLRVYASTDVSRQSRQMNGEFLDTGNFYMLSAFLRTCDINAASLKLLIDNFNSIVDRAGENAQLLYSVLSALPLSTVDPLKFASHCLEFIEAKSEKDLKEMRNRLFAYLYAIALDKEVAQEKDAVKRLQRMNTIAGGIDSAYPKFLAQVARGEKADNPILYVGLLAKYFQDYSSAIKAIYSIAEKYNVEMAGRPLENIIRDVESRIRTVNTPVSYVTKPEILQVQDVDLSLPPAIESFLRETISNCMNMGNNDIRASIGKIRSEMERVDRLIAARDEIALSNTGMPSALLKQLINPANEQERESAEKNARAYLLGKMALSNDEETAIIAMSLAHMGFTDELKRYVDQKGKLSKEEVTSLFSKLREMKRHCQEVLRGLSMEELAPRIMRSASGKPFTMMAQKLQETAKTAAAGEKHIEFTFKPKNLLSLFHGRYSGTCFGDEPSDIARDDLLVANILCDGELSGSVLFNIQGNRLIIIGIDPSERLVGSLPKEKKHALCDMIMKQIYKFAAENNFELLLTNEAAGLSNRPGIEEYILNTYAEGEPVDLEPRTYHPYYEYVVKTAQRAKPMPGVAPVTAPLAAPKPAIVPGTGADVTLAAGKYRKPAHRSVHQVVMEGLPEDLRNYANMTPEEKERVKAKYRDKPDKPGARGQIVIPITGLTHGTGLLGHIGLGQFYGEPVVYIDAAFNKERNAAVRAMIKAHELFEITRWEEKRKELGLTHEQMRAWIRANSNSAGTGPAQILADQWHREAPSIDDIYKTNTYARLNVQLGRLQRAAERLYDAIERNRSEWLKTSEKITGMAIEEIRKFSVNVAQTNDHMAVVGDSHMTILLDLCEALNDDELEWVVGHEFTHEQMDNRFDNDLRAGAKESIRTRRSAVGNIFAINDFIRNHMNIHYKASWEKLGLEAKFNNAISIARSFDPELVKELETLSKREENNADELGVFMLAKAGLDPAAGISAYEKVIRMSPELKKKGVLLPRNDEIDYDSHPIDNERLAAIAGYVAKYATDSAADVYGDETDVVLAAAPAPATVNEEAIRRLALMGRSALQLALVLNGPKPAFQASLSVQKEKDVIDQASGIINSTPGIHSVTIGDLAVIVYNIRAVRDIIDGDREFYGAAGKDLQDVAVLDDVVKAAYGQNKQGELLGYGKKRQMNQDAIFNLGVSVFSDKGEIVLGFQVIEDEAQSLGKRYADAYQRLTGNKGGYVITKTNGPIQTLSAAYLKRLAREDPKYNLKLRVTSVALAPALEFTRLGLTEPVMWLNANTIIIREDAWSNDYEAMLKKALDLKLEASPAPVTPAELSVQRTRSWIDNLNANKVPDQAVISDVHGNLKAFQELIDNFLKKGVKTFVLCGDYIDLDQNTNLAVLKFLRQLSAGDVRVEIILGNHDLKFIGTMMGDRGAFEGWIRTGGLYVLKEAGIETKATRDLAEIEAKATIENAGKRQSEIGKAIGAGIKKYIAEHPNEMSELFQATRSHEELKDLSRWLVLNSKLYHIDDNGVLYVHAGLPLDKDLNVNVAYGGRTTVEAALDLALKDFRGLIGLIGGKDPIGARDKAILDFVVGFADIKDWTDNLKAHPEITGRILSQAGVSGIVFGHEKQDRLFSAGGIDVLGIDLQMTVSYGDRGGALLYGNNGITAFGRNQGTISDNPDASFSRERLIRDLTLRLTPPATPTQAARLNRIVSNEEAGIYIRNRLAEMGMDWGDMSPARRLEMLKKMVKPRDSPDCIVYRDEATGIIFIKVKGLLSQGQLGHIGLGVTYGQPVVYIDSDYAGNSTVEGHELAEIKLWQDAPNNELKGKIKSLAEAREWMRDNIDEAIELTDKFHDLANKSFNVDTIARKFKIKTGLCGCDELPIGQNVAETPSQAAAPSRRESIWDVLQLSDQIKFTDTQKMYLVHGIQSQGGVNAFEGKIKTPMLISASVVGPGFQGTFVNCGLILDVAPEDVILTFSGNADIPNFFESSRKPGAVEKMIKDLKEYNKGKILKFRQLLDKTKQLGQPYNEVGVTNPRVTAVFINLNDIARVQFNQDTVLTVRRLMDYAEKYKLPVVYFRSDSEVFQDMRFTGGTQAVPIGISLQSNFPLAPVAPAAATDRLGAIDAGGVVISFGQTSNKGFAYERREQPDVLIPNLDHPNEIESFVLQNLFFQSIPTGMQKRYVELISNQRAAKTPQEIAAQKAAVEEFKKDAAKMGFADLLAPGIIPLMSKISTILVKSEADKKRVQEMILYFLVGDGGYNGKYGEEAFLEMLNAAGYNGGDSAKNRIIAGEIARQRSFTAYAIKDKAGNIAAKSIFYGMNRQEIIDALNIIVRIEVMSADKPVKVVKAAKEGPVEAEITFKDGAYNIRSGGRDYSVREDSIAWDDFYRERWDRKKEAELKTALDQSAADGIFRFMALGNADPTSFSGKQDYTNLAFAYNGKLILVDPSRQSLFNLEACGLTDKIDTIYITHLHEDHIGGLASMTYDNLRRMRRGESVGKINLVMAYPVYEQAIQYLGIMTQGLWGDGALGTKDFKEIFSRMFNRVNPDGVTGDMETFKFKGELEGLTFTTKRTYGHPLPTFGFRLNTPQGTLAYLADSTMPDKTRAPGRYEEHTKFFGDPEKVDILISENGVAGVHTTTKELSVAFKPLWYNGAIFTVHSAGQQNHPNLRRLNIFEAHKMQRISERRSDKGRIAAKLKEIEAIKGAWLLSSGLQKLSARFGDEITLEDKAVIFREGETLQDNPYVYIVLEGNALITSDRTEPLSRKPGEMIGEMSVMRREVDTKGREFENLRKLGYEQLLDPYISRDMIAGEEHLVWRPDATEQKIRGAGLDPEKAGLLIGLLNASRGRYPPRSRTVTADGKVVLLRLYWTDFEKMFKSKTVLMQRLVTERMTEDRRQEDLYKMRMANGGNGLSRRMSPPGYPPAPAALPVMPMLTRLKEQNTERSLTAYCRIGALWLDQPGIKDDVVKLLSSEYSSVREAAIDALAPVASQDDIRGKMIKMLRDNNRSVGRAAIRALGPIAGGKPDAKAGLISMTTNPDLDVRIAAIEAISVLADSDPDVKAVLKKRLDYPEPVTMAAVVRATARFADERDVREKFIESLRHEKAIVTAAAIEALSPGVREDKEILSGYMGVLTDRSKEQAVRADALRAIATLAAQDTAVRDVIAGMLNDGMVDVQVAAMKALAPMTRRDPAIRASIEERLDASNPTDARAAAINILAPMAGGITVKLMDILRNKNENLLIRVAVIRSLASDLREDKGIREELIKMVRDAAENQAIRIAAIEALAPAVNARDEFSGLLNDPNPSVRAAVIMAPKFIESWDQVKESVTFLLDKQNNDDAIRIMAAMAYLEGARRELEGLLDSDNKYTVRNGADILVPAISALAPFAEDNAIKERLKGMLKHENPQICVAAINALARVAGDEDVREELQNLVTHPKEGIRNAAINALRIASYGPGATFARIWEQAAQIDNTMVSHHIFLGYLHDLSHKQFLNSMDGPSWRGAVAGGFKPGPVDAVKADLTNGNVETVVIGQGARWYGRSLVVDDGKGGAAIYKIFRTNESIYSMEVEAALWNKLNPADADRATLIKAILVNAPITGPPAEYAQDTELLMLKYHVQDKDAHFKYPLQWGPISKDTLKGWMTNSLADIHTIAKEGYGYAGILEFYHDVASGRKYNLAASPVGCIDSLKKYFEYANIRAGGHIVDLNPQHMVRFSENGPTASELAQVVRDQIFQLSLIAATVASDNNMTEKDIEDILRSIAAETCRLYGADIKTLETSLPLNLASVSKEVLFALKHMQRGIDLGWDNSPLSCPGIVAFAETVAKVIADEAAATAAPAVAGGEVGVKAVAEAQVTAAKAVIGDLTKNKTDIVIMPGSDIYYPQQTAVGRSAAAKFHKDYGQETLPYSYKYGEGWMENLTGPKGVLNRAVEALNDKMKNKEDDPQIIIYVPSAAVNQLKEAIAVNKDYADVKARISVVGEIDSIPESGVVDEVMHIVLGKGLLNYQRYQDKLEPEAIDHLVNLMEKLAGAKPGEITPAILNDILKGIKFLKIRPVDFKDIADWKKSQDEVLRAL